LGQILVQIRILKVTDYMRIHKPTVLNEVFCGPGTLQVMAAGCLSHLSHLSPLPIERAEKEYYGRSEFYSRCGLQFQLTMFIVSSSLSSSAWNSTILILADNYRLSLPAANSTCLWVADSSGYVSTTYGLGGGDWQPIVVRWNNDPVPLNSPQPLPSMPFQIHHSQPFRYTALAL